MKRNDVTAVEKMWERCPQSLGDGFGVAVLIPEDEWYSMKRYIRHLRDELQRANELAPAVIPNREPS